MSANRRVFPDARPEAGGLASTMLISRRKQRTGPLRRRGLGAIAALALTVGGSGLAVVESAPGPALAGPPLPVVTTGGYHSCALMPDQTVWCWGENITGELGDGTNTDSLIPVKVPGLAPAIDVAAGEYHTCAVSATNQAWCWGSNAYGELGNGTTSQDSTTPVLAAGFSAASVSAGHEFSCAVSVLHFVRCWGDNNYGELGDGTTSDSSKPVVVKNISNVIEVAAGYYHACALEANGTLWCWGDDGNGELGNGTSGGISDVPVQVPMQNVTQVSAGNSDTCAIGNEAGHLLCWGWNIDGELGNGTFADADTPVPVGTTSTPLTGVQQVSVGGGSTCVIADAPGPTAMCWGGNDHGKLGDGTTVPSRPLPAPVFGLTTTSAGTPSGVSQIAAGEQHACVVMTTSQIQCWGDGYYGQLGTGARVDRHIPAVVIGLPGPAGSVYSVTAGGATSCAVTGALDAFCWGDYVRGGANPPKPQTTAAQVLGLLAGGVSEVSAGDFDGCVLVRTGGLGTAVRCWGDNENGQLGNGVSNIGTDATKPVTVKNLSASVTALSTGNATNCVLQHNSGAWCWGYNGYGQLGDGTTTSSDVPVAVKGLPGNLAQISVGFEHDCALLFDGTVRCWGSNSHGQLGDGSTSDSKTPVTVTGLGGVVQIAVSDSLSCALRSAGDVWCWGADNFGELGDGKSGSSNDSKVPVQVISLPGAATSIADSDETVCATMVGELVDCWGDNSVGELGTGSVGLPAMDSAPLGSLLASDGTVDVSGGGGATFCGLDTSQKAFCWGDNSVGELGDGMSGTPTDSGTPVAVQGLP